MPAGDLARSRPRHPLLTLPRFGWFWFADGVSIFGTYITAQALRILALLTLGASSFELGILRAAQWLPYLLFGLIAGVLIDRYRRKPVVVGADFIRAAVLALIPLAAAALVLSIPLLIGLILIFGAVSPVYDVAHQSLLAGAGAHRVETRPR